jgi:IS30 family transposase
MRSPGRPPSRRDLERAFWREIARGLTSEDAAVAVGVSGPVGSRWFRHRCGMPLVTLTLPSGRYLSFPEREEIALMRADGEGVRMIGEALGRSASTISRELRRNAATRGGALTYRASVAQWKAERAAQRPKVAKLVAHSRLRTYVQHHLAGPVTARNGAAVDGPAAPGWTGRNKPRRQDRAWVSAWSPEQIAHRLPIDFPDDPTMRISHEAIYQALYIADRGGLERHEVANLRTGRALRVPRARSRNRATGHVTAASVLAQRPAEAHDRAVVGHWEGDLIIGLHHSAIATVVERSTRLTVLVHLPRMDDWGQVPTVKNGPALAGQGAAATRRGLARELGALPAGLARTLTWDRGRELAEHAQLTADTGIGVYFADPHSPWQRGTNENTNGLLRQYFPKGTDLSRWTAAELHAVADTLNNRPRKTLNWRTPTEAMNDAIRSQKSTGVATTG